MGALVEAWKRLFGGDDRNTADPPPAAPAAPLPAAVVALLVAGGLWLLVRA